LDKILNVFLKYLKKTHCQICLFELSIRVHLIVKRNNRKSNLFEFQYSTVSIHHLIKESIQGNHHLQTFNY